MVGVFFVVWLVGVFLLGVVVRAYYLKKVEDGSWDWGQRTNVELFGTMAVFFWPLALIVIPLLWLFDKCVHALKERL